MPTPHHLEPTLPPAIMQRRRVRRAVEIIGFVGLAAVVAASAVVTKEAQSRRASFEALTAVTEMAPAGTLVEPPAAPTPTINDPLIASVEPVAAEAEPAPLMDQPSEPQWDVNTRWFNARPVRPRKVIWMTVTAYSPDERSCGESADNITSSIHNVWTNAMRLVAADSKVLPLGSMISVPGYDSGKVVPVLDRGGAIKGHRLDVLFATHAEARKWGVRHIPITVWEYADGKPSDDFRKIRDSKN